MNWDSWFVPKKVLITCRDHHPMVGNADEQVFRPLNIFISSNEPIAKIESPAERLLSHILLYQCITLCHFSYAVANIHPLFDLRKVFLKMICLFLSFNSFMEIITQYALLFLVGICSFSRRTKCRSHTKIWWHLSCLAHHPLWNFSPLGD